MHAMRYFVSTHALQVLSHEINQGYKYSVLPLETFNGTPVHNLAHLAAMVDACSTPYLNFGLEGGRCGAAAAAGRVGGRDGRVDVQQSRSSSNNAA